MKNSVFIISDNIITSLGFTSEENINNMKLNKSGIRLVDDPDLFIQPFFASIVNKAELNAKFSQLSDPSKFTHLEKMIILSIYEALKNTDVDVSKKNTLIIISTTKGNIDLLNKQNKGNIEQNRVYLWNVAKVIQKYFYNPNFPVVVSNACISGLLAIIIGANLIELKKYDNVIVAGADVVSEFIVSGFQSFKSLSDGPCKPFDINRNGLTLGEGCGTLILSSNNLNTENILFADGGTANDANHISGPSVNGEGLYLAVRKTLQKSQQKGIKKIDYISAHGTATRYNDEMETIALSRANLSGVPVNSLKGYWGHTLGAAGIIESIASIHSMRGGFILKNSGMENQDFSDRINVIDKLSTQEINSSLKISSGFGGCNAAAVFTKAI